MNVLIDGNNLLYAAQNKAPVMVGEREVQAVHNFCNYVRDIAVRFPHHYISVAFDGRPKWRFELLDGYKSNRKPKKKGEVKTKSEAKREKTVANVQATRPLIQSLLVDLGVNWTRSPNDEADDLAAFWANKAVEKKLGLVLVSNDGDWLQLVQPFVEVYDPFSKKLATYDNFPYITGFYKPSKFLEAKILQGDGSDTIPGIAGFGKAKSVNFIKDWGSVKEFFEKAGGKADSLSKPERDFFNAGTDEFELYKKIMQLTGELHGEPEYHQGNLNKETVRDKFSEVNFENALREFDDWIEIFEKD